MTDICKIRILFWSSFACEAVMSSTFLWMPFVNEKRAGQVITGLIFWVFLICGYVLIGIAGRKRKSYIFRKSKIETDMKQRMGILEFFSNMPAIVSDAILGTALVVALITGVTKLKETYLPYIVIFLILLSLNSHCLFNGRIYKLINTKQIRGEESHG